LNWELKAKKPQRKFISAVYEKTLECAARERWKTLSALEDDDSDAAKEIAREKQAALVELWEEYLNYEVSGILSCRSFFLGLRLLQSHDPAQNGTPLLRLARRATRSLPDSAPIWAFYMRAVEKATTPSEGVEPVEWDETIDGKFKFTPATWRSHYFISHIPTNARDELGAGIY
jgi:hypothetical protein